MKYSFVLPAYKARFLREAIDSILVQTYKNFELIIVNDASPEDLSSIIHSYNDSRIHYYVNEDNIGSKNLVTQWNHCVKYAKGEYIILASDDDIYHSEYLEKMDALVKKYPHVNLFRPRIQCIDSEGNVIHIHGYLKELIYTPEFAFYWMKGHIGSAISHYIFKKAALISIGGFIDFPMAWGSDDATALELSTGGIVFCKDLLFSFRQSGTNISSQKDNARSLKNKINAYNLFYNWLTHFTERLQPNCNEDLYYINYIKSSISSFINNNTLLIFSTSSTSAIISIFPRICKMKQIRKSTYIKGLLYSLRTSRK